MPNEYVGAILKLCQDRRGVQKDIKYLGSSGKRVQVTYEMPLSEVVFDFFDKLKSVSRGLRRRWTTSSPATRRRTWSSSTC